MWLIRPWCWLSLVMSTAVLAPQFRTAYFASDAATFTSGGQPIEAQADGTSIIRGVEIFKAGTFRDSIGEQSTWTTAHLEMMVANFNLLLAEILPNVPVRRDHSYSIDKVMGYFKSMYVVGDKLVGDLHITESSQINKLARGTYRSVSLEVGMYVTNDETPYWPVVMGLAYVDIPAVEGLHSKQMPVAYFSRNNEPSTQEQPVTATNDDRGAQRPSAFRIKGVETIDYSAVQAYITELEARPAAPTNFRVNGTDTVDFAAVQAHITTLEGFVDETRVSGRNAFVKALVSDNKVAAPQEASLAELALGMTEAQFTSFKASYELAPKLSITANHGSDANKDGDKPAGGDGQGVTESVILEEQLQMHRNAGMTEDEVQNTKAFKRLATIRNTKA